MAEFKVVIGDTKTGKSYQKVVSDDSFAGMKIGDKVNGNLVGLPEYELQITGGSDFAGFPMRKDIVGAIRKKPLVSGGVGVKIRFRKHKEEGLRIKKTVCGNTIGAKTIQVNMKIIKHGAKPLEEIFVAQPKAEEPKK